MKVFFYMGRNPVNKSRLSWKIWKIERRARTVWTWWGRAEVVKRKVVPCAGLGSKPRVFSSLEEARSFETRLIAKKIAKGYERNPRRVS